VREEEIAALLVLAEVAAPRHPFPWRAACDACFVVDRTGLNLTSVTPGMDAIFTWPSAARYAIAAANLAPALAREVLRLREPGTAPAAGIAADATATPADDPVFREEYDPWEALRRIERALAEKETPPHGR
jgi:hypothetical protein